MDASKRSCTVTVLSGKYIVCLKLSFPIAYPYNNPPSFLFLDNTNIDEEIKAKILKVIILLLLYASIWFIKTIDEYFYLFFKGFKKSFTSTSQKK